VDAKRCSAAHAAALLGQAEALRRVGDVDNADTALGEAWRQLDQLYVVGPTAAAAEAEEAAAVAAAADAQSQGQAGEPGGGGASGVLSMPSSKTSGTGGFMASELVRAVLMRLEQAKGAAPAPAPPEAPSSDASVTLTTAAPRDETETVCALPVLQALHCRALLLLDTAQREQDAQDDAVRAARRRRAAAAVAAGSSAADATDRTDDSEDDALAQLLRSLQRGPDGLLVCPSAGPLRTARALLEAARSLLAHSLRLDDRGVPTVSALLPPPDAVLGGAHPTDDGAEGRRRWVPMALRPHPLFVALDGALAATQCLEREARQRFLAILPAHESRLIRAADQAHGAGLGDAPARDGDDKSVVTLGTGAGTDAGADDDDDGDGGGHDNHDDDGRAALAHAVARLRDECRLLPAHPYARHIAAYAKRFPAAAGPAGLDAARAALRAADDRLRAYDLAEADALHVDALVGYLRALTERRAAADPEVAACLLGRAETHRLRGAYLEADSAYRAAAAVFRRCADPQQGSAGRARVAAGLGDLLLACGRPAEALAQHHRALERRGDRLRAARAAVAPLEAAHVAAADPFRELSPLASSAASFATAPGLGDDVAAPAHTENTAGSSSGVGGLPPPPSATFDAYALALLDRLETQLEAALSHLALARTHHALGAYDDSKVPVSSSARPTCLCMFSRFPFHTDVS